MQNSAAPVQTAEDRTLLVPRGAVVRTGYVAIHRIRLECTDEVVAAIMLGCREVLVAWVEVPLSGSTA